MWASGELHQRDLEVLHYTILTAKQHYKDMILFKFYGRHPFPWMQGEIQFIKPSVFGEFYTTLCGLGGDIGLAPLVHDRFNACRSNLKWLEYTCAGMATMASLFNPYWDLDGRAMLVYENEREPSLEVLVEDGDARRQLAQNAQAEVAENHSWQSPTAKEEWLGIWRTIAK